MTEHVYSADFYDYIDAGSRRSARAVSSLLLNEMRIGSVLDVGGGHGAWAAEWLAAGVPDVLAVDGDYVQADKLAIPKERFQAHDLAQPLELGRRFDLVQSLEVAEHLPEHLSNRFVESLVRHGDVVLFSAAVVYQGGEHHVNEQPPEYWRKRFAQHGYDAYDWLRPQLRTNGGVMPWYKFNSVIYANEAGAKRLSEAIRASRLADHRKLRTRGDLGWTVRRILVWLLPPALVEPAAMLKASFQNRARRLIGG